MQDTASASTYGTLEVDYLKMRVCALCCMQALLEFCKAFRTRTVEVGTPIGFCADSVFAASFIGALSFPSVGPFLEG